MRIAFFAKRKRQTRVTRSIAGALVRAGHRIRWIREARRRDIIGRRGARLWCLAELRRFDPELVLIYSADVSRSTLEAIAERWRTVLFTSDCLPEPLGGAILERARRVDLVLTVAPGQIAAFEAAGVRRAAYLPECCDPELHFPEERVDARWRCEVAFIGGVHIDQPHYAPRTQLVLKVAGQFDTKAYGSGWEALGIAPAREGIGPADYRRACAGASIVLGRDWTDACAGYFSNRTWLTLGCGGFLLTNYVPGLERLFTNHGELVWYRSEAECLELIAHYLPREAERRRIAAAGRSYALAHRTADHFVADLVDLAEGRLPELTSRVASA